MSAGPTRRDVFRAIRLEVLTLDPRSDLRSFAGGVIRPLLERTGAKAGAVTLRFAATQRELLLLATPDGPLRRRVGRAAEGNLPVDPATTAGRFSGIDLEEMARAAGVRPSIVHAAPIRGHEGTVALVELADPDPALVPDAETLTAALAQIAPVFELAFLHSRLRRERLEARLLHAVSQELGRAVDAEALLGTILDLLRQVVPYDAAAVFLLAEDALAVVRQSVRGYPEDSEELLHLKVGQGIVGWSAKTGRPQIVADVKEDPRYVDARPETRSEMVAPLRSGGHTLGVFNLESDRPDAYSSHDLELLLTFAGQAAVAVERAQLLEEREAARRLEQEVRIARRIQLFSLPRIGRSLRARGIAARTLPSLEVSGDYYDFLEREDGSVLVAVADVSGKGIPAALILSSLRTAFHLGARTTDDPARWCNDLNALLQASLRDTEFVTGVFGVLSPDRRTFRYCNAGHNPPFRVPARGETVDFLETGGMILGAFADATYTAGTVTLAPGERLVLYTDGVTEAQDPAGEEFDADRLVETVLAHRDAGANDLVAAVVRAVRRFGGRRLSDDLTVAVVGGPDPV